MVKIAVYAPALNEEKHAAAWADSTKDADYRVVLDTGCIDLTKTVLMNHGVSVYNATIKPWRFDDAYNVAMALCPADADVLICLHMDERLCDGWRKLVEDNWINGVNRLRYTYIWSWNPDGTPGRTWLGDRIHGRAGYRWVGSTHEGLCCRFQHHEISAECRDLKILHFPDAKDKSGDLYRLQEAVQEAPHDARMKAYLGREFMYQGDNENATKTYKEFLTMSYDKTERGQAMVTLASTDPENKVFWLKMAALEVPNHREPLFNLAQHYYDNDWPLCYKYIKETLALVNHPNDYTCTPEAWGYIPNRILSIAAWSLNLYQESFEHAKISLDKNPSDPNLLSNYNLIRQGCIDRGLDV
jgi:tetratricopeptide (TPR) repeat protein